MGVVGGWPVPRADVMHLQASQRSHGHFIRRRSQRGGHLQRQDPFIRVRRLRQCRFAINGQTP